MGTQGLLFRRSLVALLFVLMPSACCSIETTPKDWETVGLYRTPRQSFRTFQVALAEDVPVLGHRSFSLQFMDEHNLSGMAWRLALQELEVEMPFFRCLGKAEIVEEISLAPDRCRLIAELNVLFSHHRFQIDFVREDYWEAWSGDERLSDDVGVWSELVEGNTDRESVLLHVPTGGEFTAADVTEYRVGREWKIDGFTTLD